MTTSPADSDDPTKARVSDLATLMASGLGSGLSPVAPGTAGSIAAVAVLAIVMDMPLAWHWCAWVGLLGVAVWSAGRAGEAWGVIDHPAIVIDEVAGVWLALLIPLSIFPFEISSALLLVGSLLLFRLFDIVKPWPVDAAERGFPGAWGVVLDDVVAGLLAGGCMTLILIGITAG